jgi:hypothetical protein
MNGVPSSAAPSNVRGDGLPVPVQLFRRVSVVDNVDDNLLTLLEAQQGTGKLSVIGRDAVRRQFDQPVADSYRVIRGTL